MKKITVMMVAALLLTGCGIFKKSQKITKLSGVEVEILKENKTESKSDLDRVINTDTNLLIKNESDQKSDIVLEGNIKISPDGTIQADKASIKNNVKRSDLTNLNIKSSDSTKNKKEDRTSDNIASKIETSYKEVDKKIDPKTSTYVYILIAIGVLIMIYLFLRKRKVL